MTFGFTGLQAHLICQRLQDWNSSCLGERSRVLLPMNFLYSQLFCQSIDAIHSNLLGLCHELFRSLNGTPYMVSVIILSFYCLVIFLSFKFDLIYIDFDYIYRLFLSFDFFIFRNLQCNGEFKKVSWLPGVRRKIFYLW